MEAPDGAQGKERKLESWGEIAAYLRREIRTVQRWEKTLGLPIRRLQVGKQSSVYAYPSELDKWYREREPKVFRTIATHHRPFNKVGFDAARQRYGLIEQNGKLVADGEFSIHLALPGRSK